MEEIKEKKILDLPLKKEWYMMIENGIKKEEYREIKPYWIKRLFKEQYSLTTKLNDSYIKSDFSEVKGKIFPTTFDAIRFRYGYTKRTMLFKLNEITIGQGKIEHGALPATEVFILKLGNRIK